MPQPETAAPPLPPAPPPEAQDPDEAARLRRADERARSVVYRGTVPVTITLLTTIQGDTTLAQTERDVESAIKTLAGEVAQALREASLSYGAVVDLGPVERTSVALGKPDRR